MFPVKAIFWILVVAAFVPKGFSAPEDGAFAREATFIAAQFDASGARGDVQAAASDVCLGREQVCTIVGEAADIAGFMVSLAADRAEAVAVRQKADEDVAAIDQLFAEAAAGDQPAR